MRSWKFYTSAIVVLFAFFSKVNLAQSNDEILSHLFKERVELYFKFEIESPKELFSLTKIISLDNIKGTTVYAYANQKEFARFMELGYTFEALTPPSMLITPEMKDQISVKGITEWDFYPTYQAYISMMYQFQADYPGLCQVVNIGQSIQGRELLFARISDNVGLDEGEPQFMYTGTIHGDETTGYILLLRLIDYLLTNYGSDPRITNMVNNLDIWINPAANPDGTYHGGNNTVYGATRYNANGVDLNRNYPDPQDGPHPDGNPWQVETVAFMNFAENHHFVSSANTHGGAEVCNYPWDTWATLHADDAWWQYVCHEYADTAQLYSPNGYMNGFDDGITNGYAWYEVAGGRQDYMTYFHQCREFTLEMSDTKLLPANQLPALWQYNYRSLLNYMEQTIFGIQGTVTDATTGNPLKAEIFIANHDADSSWVYSGATTGKYTRLIHAGNWNVTFSAPGYFPQTIQNVAVVNRQLTTLNVQLNPGNLIPDFTASATNIPVGSTISFTDISYGNPVSWQWTFEGANPPSSNAQNPTNITYPTAGNFDVSLTVSDGSNSQSITKQNYITANVDFVMQNTTITTCNGVFYDSGGLSSNYSDNEDFTLVFLPGQAGAKIKCEFISFNVEPQSNCNYDWLKIYNGPNSSSPLLGTWCGTNSPGIIEATNAQGAITFVFHSDESVTKPGWTATISCTGGILPPVADFTADLTSIIEGESVHFTNLSLNNPATWIWTFEGGDPATSTLENPVIAYFTEGLYDVTLAVTNEGGTNTMTKYDYIYVDHVTNLENVYSKEIILFPNPVDDMLMIQSPANIQSIDVFDILGSQVMKITPEANQCSLNFTKLDAGIYFLKVQTDKENVTKKIQVVK